jgi:hypothetical protein
MAEYLLFHDFRRLLLDRDVSGLSAPITCHKTKDQLSHWLKTQMNPELAKSEGSLHCVQFASFEHAALTPISYLHGEVFQYLGTSIERLVSSMIRYKGENPDAYGDKFTHEVVNVHGRHSYDSDIIPETDDVLVALKQNVPEDFFDNFKNRIIIDSQKPLGKLLCLLPRDSLSIGVAVLAKSSKLIQIHVGITIKNPVHVRIIIDEFTKSDLDKMIGRQVF